MALTVLGCSGSYGAPAGGRASGYLCGRAGVNLWLDCGNGTFATLQRHHRLVPDIDAVVCHPLAPRPLRRHRMALRASPGGARERRPAALPVFDPGRAGGPARHPGRRRLGGVFAFSEHTDWRLRRRPAAAGGVGGGFRLLLLPHRPSPRRPSPSRSRRMGSAWCTRRTPARAGRSRRSRPVLDLVLSEATLDRRSEGAAPRAPVGPPGRRAARAAGARRLVLTHLWPGLDPAGAIVEGSEAFGPGVPLASATSARGYAATHDQS